MKRNGDAAILTGPTLDPMAFSNILLGLLINLLVPLGGIGGFAYICYRMWETQLPLAPYISYFLLFVTYGSGLMLLLTAAFWYWSDMATFGFYYLALVAPFLLGGSAFVLRGNRSLSSFHSTAYFLSAAYTLVAVLAGIAWAASCLLNKA